jgi:hypothetical protein
MTAERPEWIGWLPDDVQEIANAAARAGDDDESFDLWAPGGRYLACVGPVGDEVSLFHGPEGDDPENELLDGDCDEVTGLDAVLAWVAAAVDSAPAKA